MVVRATVIQLPSQMAQERFRKTKKVRTTTQRLHATPIIGTSIKLLKLFESSRVIAYDHTEGISKKIKTSGLEKTI